MSVASKFNISHIDDMYLGTLLLSTLNPWEQ